MYFLVFFWIYIFLFCCGSFFVVMWKRAIVFDCWGPYLEVAAGEE